MKLQDLDPMLKLMLSRALHSKSLSSKARHLGRASLLKTSLRAAEKTLSLKKLVKTEFLNRMQLLLRRAYRAD